MIADPAGSCAVSLDRPTPFLDARPVAPRHGERRGVGLGEVALLDGFWRERQDVNAAATLRHCYDWMDRLGWLANFDRVAERRTEGPRPGWQFSDSEVYKLMEALAWEHGRSGDAAAGALLDELTARVAAAQDADGYLNTCFGHAGQRARYSDLERGHELYCTGHLLQAAVARLRTVGADELVAVARRAADHVCREFGPDGREGICGHPEVEVALAEFGRATGDDRYVDQARLFVDRRGRGLLAPIPLLGRAYFQDDVPVREADVWRGHAVRALYLAAGAVDVATELGDDVLLAAVQRQWDRSVARRTYITGGMGSRHQDEGFGDDWELSTDRAYCETCAGVASVMVSWRLYLATGDVKYADLMERTFFNVLATSPRSDGRAFFYANPLQQRVAGVDVSQDAVNPRAEGGLRAAWFDVSCCPTNVARALATWHTYSASIEGDELTVLQYASARIRVPLAGGGSLGVRVTTQYPADGRVTFEVDEAPRRPVGIRLRVPHWAEGAVLVDGRAAPRTVGPGWATIRRTLQVGERIVLDLPVDPRLTWPDPRIDAVRGCVAVERGPVVLCAESVDLPAGVSLDEIVVDVSHGLAASGDGATVAAVPMPARSAGRSVGLPYGDGVAVPESTGDPLELRLVPYHSWAERGPSTMRVFLPVERG